jgi:hypothetical protein
MSSMENEQTSEIDYPDDPPGIDPTTNDMPHVAEAAERVNEFIRWFGDGRVLVDPDEIGPPLYTRDMETLTRLVTRPAVTPAALVALLTEHEYRWTTHGNDRPYDVIHCAGDCDWRLRQKALMSDDYVIEQHRQHVAEQIAELVTPPGQP